MIDRQALLSDLQQLLGRLEADLLERSESTDVPDVGETLRAEYGRAKEAQRTAQNYEDWRTDAITQAAAAWVLSCVFVRFLEDNRLIDPPQVAGPGDRLQRARDEHELYFRSHSRETDREYLLAIFDALAGQPGTRDIFGPHNPIRELPNWLSGDAAGELLRFFQKVNPDSGLLIHDFTDPQWDTRFLGDLYQDLSEAARKKYALLQTPEFVEEFILDRTLEPALDEFGLTPPLPQGEGRGEGVGVFKLIDPACGSGHFLLGAFRRILDRWQRQDPGANPRELVQRTLDSIYGVDVNPYAVAIARFRLLLVAMGASDVRRLADAPAFRMHLACGDSLLHGAGAQTTFGYADVDHATQAEDLDELRRILVPGRYHAVVANPPYITPKDRALNQAYRDRYAACHMKYSLSVPFMERICRLAVPAGENTAAGYAGQITANSFMKREFGKKLIESFLPTVDLTHVIDTSGAYIPGHGTPTVILFVRNRRPLANTIRTVMGIRGEPATPDDPARGLVWSSIVGQIDRPGSQSDFVSVGDSARELFHRHPWSIGGGGAAELKERLEEGDSHLCDILESIGPASFSSMDDAFICENGVFQRRGVPSVLIRKSVQGESVRDWVIETSEEGFCAYDADFSPLPLEPISNWGRLLWPSRTCIASVLSFGGRTRSELGEKWWTWYRWITERYRCPSSIAFADIATHNHFVLDRGGKVFNRTAPVIKLPAEATEDDHLALLGLLNSSTACFWMKQVCFPKGGDHVGQQGARVRRTLWDERFAFNGTNIQQLPLPSERPLARTSTVNTFAERRQQFLPGMLFQSNTSSRESLTAAQSAAEEILGRTIAHQEELDWECYRLYGLIEADLTIPQPPAIKLAERAFEIVLARQIVAGETQTTWFERHGSTPITEIPAEWPEDYRQLVQRRIELIESDPNIRLIEQPEYKRRWNTEPWGSQLERALHDWLLDRLESYFDFDGRMNDAGKPTARLEIGLISMGQLADIARRDPEFLRIGELYRDDAAFDVTRLVTELVEAESVPLLPVLRYKPSGRRKRAEWAATWDLQRQEDAMDARTQLPATDPDFLSEADAAELKRREVGTIPIPPKYTSADFLKSDYWRLRGKLDVPKERWGSFPHCPGADGTPLVAWAGYDHLQLARAISAYYVDVQERQGGRDDPRLIPLLAGLLELIPWLKQWHNQVDPEFGLPMGDYFEGFVEEEARQLGKTLAEIKGWEPPVRTRGRARTRIQQGGE